MKKVLLITLLLTIMNFHYLWAAANQNLSVNSLTELADLYLDGGATYNAITDGDTCDVVSTSPPGAAKYIYDDNSAATEDSPFYITPDESSAGNAYSGDGRWVLVGNMNGVPNVESISDNPTALTSAMCFGTVFICGATMEIDLPAVATGMYIVIYNNGAYTLTIDPDASDRIVREGTAQADGVSMTLASGAGNFVILWVDGANGWTTLGSKGTLAQGS